MVIQFYWIRCSRLVFIPLWDVILMMLGCFGNIHLWFACILSSGKRGGGRLQLTLCLFWEPCLPPISSSPPSPHSLTPLFSYPNGNCLGLPGWIHVHPCAVSHGYPFGALGADFENLPSQLMRLESFATFNGLSQQCNCKCCMLTCALMVARACLLGVLMGQFWLGRRGWWCQINGGGGEV